jgi:hypothetical protein
LEHREKFLTAEYNSKPDAVFALISYLSICSPLSITLDVNKYSRAAAAGEVPFGKQAPEKQAKILINPIPTDGSVKKTKTTKEAAKLFIGPNFDDPEVREFQNRSCVSIDEKVDSETLAAVRVFEAQFYQKTAKTPSKDGKLNNMEWTKFLELSVKCVDPKKFANFYENVTFGQHYDPKKNANRNGAARAQEQFLIQILATHFPKELPTYKSGLTFGDPIVRAAIKAARAKFVLGGSVKDLRAGTEHMLTQDLFITLGNL